MIPLRDSTRSRTFPFVTITLIVVNVLVFLREVTLGEHAQAFIVTWGFVPSRFFAALDGTGDLGPAAVPLLSSIFLHGGLMHLLGNMWFLWIFGDNVEDRLGHGLFVPFYVGCGVLAGLAHAASSPSAGVPAVGASGAIAGVLGAYFIFFPRGRVLALLPLFIVFTTIEVPAVFFLVVWFVMQLWSGTISLGAGSTGGGVAWWAHIGGFIVGAAVAFAFVRTRFGRPRRHAARPPLT